MKHTRDAPVRSRTFRQWSYGLLPEMQHEIAMCLDPYSRQVLAMTSTATWKKWGTPELSCRVNLGYKGCEKYIANEWKALLNNDPDNPDIRDSLRDTLSGIAKRGDCALFAKYRESLIAWNDRLPGGKAFYVPIMIAHALIKASNPTMLEWAIRTFPPFLSDLSEYSIIEWLLDADQIDPPNPRMVPLLRPHCKVLNWLLTYRAVLVNDLQFLDQVKTIDPEFNNYMTHEVDMENVFDTCLCFCPADRINIRNVQLLQSLLELLPRYVISDTLCAEIVEELTEGLAGGPNEEHIIARLMSILPKLAEKKPVFGRLLL